MVSTADPQLGTTTRCSDLDTWRSQREGLAEPLRLVAESVGEGEDDEVGAGPVGVEPGRLAHAAEDGAEGEGGE